ncbi:MAG: acyl-CoA dehydrogenase [Dehalococcoidia bacterium]|nr:acyl-CoA dehydrogenase [Dehalococcoidia bacterium]
MGYLLDYPVAPELQAFQEEVREFLRAHLTREVVEERQSGEWGNGLGRHGRRFLREMGKRGWLGLTWPAEYGGLGKTVMHRFILAEEMEYADAPQLGTGPSIVGPCLMLYGSDGQKREFLPGIARGEIAFALGYTEPEAGSDLASLQLAAREDGDEYVLRGQKIFNTETHVADYVWLAARTDTQAPKHKGISLFIVDAHSRGLSVQPIYTAGDHRTNIVFYDDVRVPRRNLLGEPNKGWYYLATALDLERFFPVSGVIRQLELIIWHAKQPRPGGGSPLIEDALVRRRLAELVVQAQAVRSISYRMAWLLGQGSVPNIEASILKLYLREFAQRVGRAGVEIMGLYGQLRPSSALAPLGGEVEKYHRASPVLTISGGSSEIQRNIIATRGLELPR